MKDKIACDYVLDYILRKENLKDENILSEQERFKILQDNMAKDEVFKYLENKLQALTIEVCGDYSGLIFDLMPKRLLEGWCWQTTDSAIVFLPDDDYIERGNLIFDKYEKYWHSWINFHYNNNEYTFDPCLNFLCDKRLYQDIFETNVKGTVYAKEVKDELKDAILNSKPKKINNSPSAVIAREFMKKHFGDYLEQQKNETLIVGNNDVTSPMYRNNTGYKADIEDGKIKKLVANFYQGG